MIRPLDNRLLVEPVVCLSASLWTPEQRSRWGNGQKVSRGRVVATGPGPWLKSGARRPVDVRIGDVVHFSDSCGKPVQDGDKTLYFIREDDIAFVEDEPVVVADFIGAREDYDREA